MFGTHLSRLGSVHRLTLVHKAIGILRKYGTNAHVYLPGVGTVSGITAGNYLDSAGTTAASVDNPVGLSLDALQAMTLGAELNPNPDTGAMTPGGTTAPTFSTTTYLGLNCRAITFNLSGAVSYATANAVSAAFGPAVAIGTVEVISYKISLSRALLSGEILQLFDLPHGVYLRQITAADTSAVGSFITVNGQEATSLGAGTASAYALYAVGTFSGGPITAYLTAVSFKQIPGIHATQATTANKPILRQSAGKYSWQFDGSNDSLSLSAPLFQMSDDHAVIAGFNQATAANGYVFSQNNTAATTLVGAISVTSGGNARALWADDAATTAFITGSIPVTGLNKVVSAIKRTNAKKLRVNGVQDGATDNTVMGGTTLNTASIGSYTTAGNFQGSIYPVIAIKGTVSDADLLTLERWVGQLSGVSI